MSRSSKRPGRNQNHNARRKGQSLVELAAILLTVIPVLLILIDCLFILIGASLNDSICRDAARAAAAGPPSVVDAIATPQKRALTVIDHVYYSNMPMKVRDIVSIKENVRTLPPDSQGGYVDGEITIGTTIDIYPPFVPGNLGSSQIVLKSQHTVPITYVLPPS